MLTCGTVQSNKIIVDQRGNRCARSSTVNAIARMRADDQQLTIRIRISLLEIWLSRCLKPKVNADGRGVDLLGPGDMSGTCGCCRGCRRRCASCCDATEG